MYLPYIRSIIKNNWIYILNKPFSQFMVFINKFQYSISEIIKIIFGNLIEILDNYKGNLLKSLDFNFSGSNP